MSQSHSQNTHADQVDWFEKLSELPSHDQDSWRTERLRRRAHQQLNKSHRMHTKSWWMCMRRAYRYVLEPSLVASASAAYLGWSFNIVWMILGR